MDGPIRAFTQAGVLRCKTAAQENEVIQWFCAALDEPAHVCPEVRSACACALVLVRTPEGRKAVAQHLLHEDTLTSREMCEAVRHLLLNPLLWGDMLREVDDTMSCQIKLTGPVPPSHAPLLRPPCSWEPKTAGVMQPL